jgi:hypothetical protein
MDSGTLIRQLMDVGLDLARGGRRKGLQLNLGVRDRREWARKF